MNLVFLIGVEGSGHHLFGCCCTNKGNDFWKFKSVLDKLLERYFDYNISIKTKLKLKNEITLHIKNNQNLELIITSSFPYNRPIDSLRRYDILEFYELFENNPYVNMFFVILVRDIVYSTLSAHNRFGKDVFNRESIVLEAKVLVRNIMHATLSAHNRFGKDVFNRESIVLEAKVQEDNLIYINSQIQLLPKNKYIIVQYNDICNNPSKFGKILQEKSNFNDLFFNAENVIKADDSKHINNKHYNYLCNYFNAKRLKQFEYINSNITQI